MLGVTVLVFDGACVARGINVLTWVTVGAVGCVEVDETSAWRSEDPGIAPHAGIRISKQKHQRKPNNFRFCISTSIPNLY
jgi:hypothetical protein